MFIYSRNSKQLCDRQDIILLTITKTATRKKHQYQKEILRRKLYHTMKNIHTFRITFMITIQRYRQANSINITQVNKILIKIFTNTKSGSMLVANYQQLKGTCRPQTCYLSQSINTNTKSTRFKAAFNPYCWCSKISFYSGT